MSKRISPLLAAAMSLMLSGCFISDQAKFPLSTAQAAFGEGGRYEVLEHLKGDDYRHQEIFVVRHLGTGSYEFTNEKKEVLPITFHPLAKDLYVGQAQPNGKDKPGYGYVVVRMTGNDALIYAPQCDEQDNAKLTTFKVGHRDKYTCNIDEVTDPLGLFSVLKLGEPISKMLRQQS